jgi:hypothetical protein
MIETLIIGVNKNARISEKMNGKMSFGFDFGGWEECFGVEMKR